MTIKVLLFLAACQWMVGWPSAVVAVYVTVTSARPGPGPGLSSPVNSHTLASLHHTPH